MAILFDFNGTMFFDEQFQEISWRKFVGEKIGRNISDEEFSKYIHGRNADFTMEYFLNKKFSREEIAQLEEEKEKIYRNLCESSLDFKLAPGLTSFLDNLKQKNVSVNIATASGWRNVRFFFDGLELNRWFDINKVVYNDGTYPGKPEPHMYLKAAEKIGVPIEECYVFEDSDSGIEAARRAGAKGIIKVLSMKDSSIETDIYMNIKTFDEINAVDFV